MDIVNLLASLGARDKQKGEAEKDFLHRLKELLAKAGYRGRWSFRAQVMLLFINTDELPTDKMAELKSFVEKCDNDYCMAVLAEAKRLFGSAVLTPEEAKAVINDAIAGGKAAAPQPVAPKPPSPKRRVGRK